MLRKERLKMTDKIMLQLKAAKEIKRMHFDKQLVHQKSAEDILKLKDIIAEYELSNKYYEDFLFIQCELIDNKYFPILLKNIKSKFPDCDMAIINLILKLINCDVLKISINDISDDVLYFIIENIHEFNFYNNVNTLLSNFIYICNNRNINEDIKVNIISNLKYFIEAYGEINIEDFSNEEIKEFITSNIKLCNRERKIIKEFCSYASKNSNIKDIFALLTEKKAKVILYLEEIKLFSDNTNAASNIKYIINKLDFASYIEYFFSYWECDNFSDKELTVFSELCKINSKETLYSILSNRVSFIASIYKDEYFVFSNLSDLTNAKQDLYIYAIVNNKKAFLKLVKENEELFKSIPEHSLLFSKDFREHVNINALNIKNIEELKSILQKKVNKYLWQDNVNYLFNEVKELATARTEYIKFYKMLDIDRIDEKLIILKEVKNKNLLYGYGDESVRTIAEKLSVKSIYLWIKEDFNNISDLKINVAVKLLIIYDKMSHFIKQLKNNDEAEFLIRNADNDIFNLSEDMEYIKSNIMEIDSGWKSLCDKLNLTEKFINENKESIYNFCVKNGTGIANTYYKNLNKTGKEKYLKVVKAEISGKFNNLKYFGNDLSEELNINISEELKQKWIYNNDYCKDEIKIIEKDDFYSTMILGIKPRTTCISYINGTYSECLLSNFDSNKKFIFAYLNGEIVGRAIIRLTKAYNAIDKNKSYLDFVDVEDISENQNNKNKEFPVIFLERAYFSGISDEMIHKIKEMFIKIVQVKTFNMGIKLIVCSFYKDIITENKDFTAQKLSLYVSLSKAGNQYLDSMGGNKTTVDEGKYFTEVFYIN